MFSDKALILFSGGQDSTTCLHWALQHFENIEAVTFDYGQRHNVELEVAKSLCEKHGIKQHILNLSAFSQIGGNSLVDFNQNIEAAQAINELPNTFVPGRNAVFLSLAAGLAYGRGITQLVVGASQADYSGYPDCRDPFFQSMEKSLSLALDHGIQIHRPLMFLTKAQTFDLARRLGALEEVLEFSHTCYQGDRKTAHAWGYGCGTCPSCELRMQGYEKFLLEIPADEEFVEFLGNEVGV